MQKKLLTNGNAFKRTDGRWCGVVWYMDEHGERKRKSFSGTTKAEVNKKITQYIADFENQAAESDESKKTLQESMQNWLQVFKLPSVEQTTYDRCECSAKNQIYPLLGEKAVGDITAADIKNLLNYWMNKCYAYTTVKKAYVILNEYFRYLYREELIPKNPMANVEMMKKGNFLSTQNKENLPECETVTIFTPEEIEKYVHPCGLGKSKARDISACMKMLRDVYDGHVPDDFDALLSLPGVGRKSANLIMGDVFGRPAIVTDTHCIRLVNRMGLVDGIKEPAKVEKELWKIIPPKEGSDFCHRLVYHGREVCTARTHPYCEKCCISDICKKVGV